MNTSPFAQAQTETLLALRKGLPDVRTVLVGAAALACQMDMRWRKTNDLDLTVVAEEADLANKLRALGWERHERYEQRWTSLQGVVVDALPASPASLAEGKLVFTRSGHVMSLVGFDLALAHCAVVPLDGATDLEVATVPVIAVLKMTAWLDRPAERERDLPVHPPGCSDTRLAHHRLARPLPGPWPRRGGLLGWQGGGGPGGRHGDRHRGGPAAGCRVRRYGGPERRRAARCER